MDQQVKELRRIRRLMDRNSPGVPPMIPRLLLLAAGLVVLWLYLVR